MGNGVARLEAVEPARRPGAAIAAPTPRFGPGKAACHRAVVRAGRAHA